MDYDEWTSLKIGDKVKDSRYGSGIIIACCGIGYVVQFTSGVTKRISDGFLHRINSRKNVN